MGNAPFPVHLATVQFTEGTDLPALLVECAQTSLFKKSQVEGFSLPG